MPLGMKLGDRLDRKWYGAALLALVEYEQPTELPRKTFESRCEGPFKSVGEIKIEDDENKS